MKPDINYTGFKHADVSRWVLGSTVMGELPFSLLSNRKSLKVGWRVMELPVETYCRRSSRGVNLSDGNVRALTSTNYNLFS